MKKYEQVIILACRLLMAFKYAIMNSLRFDPTALAFQAVLRQLFHNFWKQRAQISHRFPAAIRQRLNLVCLDSK